MISAPPRSLIYALFLVSGGTGLIYELVWTRELIFVLGGTTYAITTVLVAFMSGLALGAYVAGRIAHRLTQPGRAYGLLEIAIGSYALAVPALLAVAEPLYRALYPHVPDIEWVLTGVRFLVGALVLLVPTTLMGATLPLLVRFVTLGGQAFGKSVGLLYGINTLGAMFGTVVAGFYLIQTFGLTATTQVAAAGNLLIGLTALVLLRARAVPAAAQAAAAPTPAVTPLEIGPNLRRVVLFAFAASGFAAMVYQIAWTRALIMSIGSSTYAFTCILAAFILGLALGSLVIARWVDRWQQPVLVFGVMELGIALAAILIVPLHGRVPLLVRQLVDTHYQNYDRLLAWQFLLVIAVTIVPTLLMGAIFPLVTRVLASRDEEAGAAVGRAYAVNTVGTIAGSFLAGFVLIRSDVLGIQNSIVAAALLNALVGAALVIGSRPAGVTVMRRAIACAVLVLAVPLIAGVTGRWNRQLLLSAPYLHRAQGNYEEQILYFAEGVDTTVAVLHVDPPHGEMSILINGKPDASTGMDMATQLLLGHLPALLCPDGRSACVVGLGSGMTLSAVARYPSFERIDCAEISAEVIRAAGFFAPYTYNVLTADPRVRVFRADGRNHLLLTDQTYDVIVSEPSNPWISGIANLFTREYFELCRRRLSPHGVFCVWLQAYSTTPEDFRLVVRTLQRVFPSVSVWDTNFPEYILIARPSPTPIPLDEIRRRFEQPPVREDLYRIGHGQLAPLLGLFVTDGQPLRDWAASAPIHTDDNALLEFSAARHLYHVDPATIDRMFVERQRSLLDELLVASADGEYERVLRARIAAVAESRRAAVDARAQLTGRQTGTGFRALLDAYRRDPGNRRLYRLLTESRDNLLRHDPLAARSARLASVLAEIDHLRMPTIPPPTGGSLGQIAHLLILRAAQAGREQRWAVAADYLAEAHDLKPGDSQTVSLWASALAQSGQLPLAMVELDRFLIEHPGDGGCSYTRAVLAARAGDYDTALAHLETALAAGFVTPENIRENQALGPLRADPRFIALVDAPAQSRPTSAPREHSPRQLPAP